MKCIHLTSIFRVNINHTERLLLLNKLYKTIKTFGCHK